LTKASTFVLFRTKFERQSSIQASIHCLQCTDQEQRRTIYDGKTRQLLGLKKPSTDTTEKWKIRLQLTKPISWIPLSLIVMCGAAATGNYHCIWNPFDSNDRDVMLGMSDALKELVTMIFAGPFSEGFAQTINNW
jgi:chlorophyll synthase